MCPEFQSGTTMSSVHSSVPENRCGHIISGDKLPGPGLNTQQCCRQVDQQEEKCIWHVKHRKKEAKALNNNLDDPLESPEVYPDGQVPRVPVLDSYLVDINNAGQIELDHVNLVLSTCYHTDFSGGSFENSYLQRSDFTFCNFEEANLTNCNISECHFACSILDRAVLSNVHAHSASFIRASLKNANINSGYFEDARFNQASLQKVNPTNASRIKRATFDQAGFSEGVDISGIDGNLTSFNGCDLVDADFSDTHLREAKFINTGLRGCDFRHAHIREASFEGATINRMETENNDFEGCSMNNTEINETVFKNSNFSTDCLEEAELHDVEFRESNLKTVDFTLTSQFKRPAIVSSNIDEAKFDDLHLAGSTWRDIDSEQVLLRNVVFSGAEFENVKLSASNLMCANFDSVDLSDCGFPASQMPRTILRGCNLKNIDLTGANLSHSKCHEANFEGAILNRAIASYSDMSGANLQNTKLNEAVLNRANLENSLLSGADLRGASFIKAGMYQSVIRDIIINDYTRFGGVTAYETVSMYTYVLPTEYDISRHRAASWTYRQLEELYRRNADPETAIEYHIKHKRAIQNFYKENSKYKAKYYLSKSNEFVSNFGNNPWKPIKRSAQCIFCFGLLYPLIGVSGVDGSEIAYPIRPSLNTSIEATTLAVTNVDIIEMASSLISGILFSVFTFTTVGFGAVEIGGISAVLAAIESILGNLLLAIFVFVLGRRATY